MAEAEARLRVLAMLEARLAGDPAAWDSLWVDEAEECAEALVAALELLLVVLDGTPSDPGEALASVAELRSLVIADMT